MYILIILINNSLLGCRVFDRCYILSLSISFACLVGARQGSFTSPEEKEERNIISSDKICKRYDNIILTPHCWWLMLRSLCLATNNTEVE